MCALNSPINQFNFTHDSIGYAASNKSSKNALVCRCSFSCGVNLTLHVCEEREREQQSKRTKYISKKPDSIAKHCIMLKIKEEILLVAHVHNYGSSSCVSDAHHHSQHQHELSINPVRHTRRAINIAQFSDCPHFLSSPTILTHAAARKSNKTDAAQTERRFSTAVGVVQGKESVYESSSWNI